MYSREKRKKAIELYIKYDKCAADVNHELGYPDRKTLTRWYKDYVRTGLYWEGYTRCQRSKYSLGQKETAVEYYLEHGRNLSRTVRALGYPSRDIHSGLGAMSLRQGGVKCASVGHNSL